MEEILGNVSEYSVKQAWDILQENQRQMHLSGRKKESTICSKCHHGAKKIEKQVSIDGDKRSDYTYQNKNISQDPS